MSRNAHFASRPSEGAGGALVPTALSRQEFGRRLQKLMLERNWNQSDLARASELGRDAISTYINGRNFPLPVSLDKLANALNVSRDDLLPNAQMSAIDAEHPEFELRVAAGHPGQAWVRVNRRMSMDTATKIANLLSAEDAPPTAE